MKKICLFVLLVPFSWLSTAQENNSYKEYANLITRAELQEHVKTLASEAFGGRGTGEPGQKLASEYLMEQLSRSGLPGASSSGNPYYQEFKLSTGAAPEILLISKRDTFSSDERIVSTGSVSTLGKKETVFMGFGIDHPKYSDYTADLSVEDKIVIFLAGEPKTKKGWYVLSESYLPLYTDRGKSKAKVAYNKGAALVIRIDPDQDRVLKLANIYSRFQSSGSLSLLSNTSGEEMLPDGIIHIGSDDATKLLGLKSKQLQKFISKMNKGKTTARKSSIQVEIQSGDASNLVETENIVAFLEGTDLKHEWIIVTAHFDHLGTRNGQTYFGADDNASGTAALIEVAESFAEMAKNGIRPRRSILFLPVSGEERGLLGSRFYVENPIFPLEKTKAVINMDMIGRTDNDHTDHPNYVNIYVSDSSNGRFAALARKAAANTQDSLTTEFRYKETSDYRMGGSDHASFEKKGIPVLYFFNGLHEDYHRPSDTWDKIEYDKMTHIAQLVFYSALELANQEFD